MRCHDYMYIHDKGSYELKHCLQIGITVLSNGYIFCTRVNFFQILSSYMIKQRRLFINEGYQSSKLPLSNFHRLICLLDFSEIVIDNLHRTTAKKVYKYNLLLMLARTLEALHLHRFNSRHSGYVYILVECTAIILYSRKIKHFVRNKLFISDNGHDMETEMNIISIFDYVK